MPRYQVKPESLVSAAAALSEVVFSTCGHLHMFLAGFRTKHSRLTTLQVTRTRVITINLERRIWLPYLCLPHAGRDGTDAGPAPQAVYEELAHYPRLPPRPGIDWGIQHFSTRSTLELPIRFSGGQAARATFALPFSTFVLFGNDPSAGSPTETLLRLLLPLNDQVWSSFQHSDATRKQHHQPIRRPH